MTDHRPDPHPSTQLIVVGPSSGEDSAEPIAVETAPGSDEGVGAAQIVEAVEQPAKVMRIGSMIKQLLDEVRQAPLDAASRQRLRAIYELSVQELAAGLSPDLRAELDRLALPFESDEPSEAELRIAQAQLVGWLEGLFHGIQAALFAQQMAARAQLDEMRQRGLPPGMVGVDRTQPGAAEAPGRAGPYL